MGMAYLSFILPILWLPLTSAAGCCSQNHKACITWCGNSQAECAACQDGTFVWLPNGENSDPNPQCIPRWNEQDGQCDSNSDCCGTLVCDNTNNKWNTVCQHPVAVCNAYNQNSCEGPHPTKDGKILEKNCEWNGNKCVPNFDYRVLGAAASSSSETTTATTTTTTTQPPPSTSAPPETSTSVPPGSGTCELPSYLKKFSVITRDDMYVKAKNTYTGLVAGGDIEIGVQNQIQIWTAGNSRGIPQNERLVLSKSTSGGRLQCNQCSIKQVADPLQTAGIDWNELVWLSENLVDSTDGDFMVKVFTSGGDYNQHMVRDKDWQDEDNGRTLIVFNTDEDVNLVMASDGDKWGPSVLAPKAKVTLAANTDYVDGWVVAKSFYSMNNGQQLHGDEYDGPIECRETTATTTTTTTTTTQPPPENTTPPPPMDCTMDLKNQGSDYCPDDGGVTILKVRGTASTPSDADVVWGITETDGSGIKLKVKNPFDSEMKVYVQYKESVADVTTLECISYDLRDCRDQSAPEIHLNCFNGHESSVTVLQIFFVDPNDSNPSVFGPVDVAECCHAGDPPPSSVAQYSVMLRCDCKDAFSSVRFLRGD